LLISYQAGPYGIGFKVTLREGARFSVKFNEFEKVSLAKKRGAIARRRPLRELENGPGKRHCAMGNRFRVPDFAPDADEKRERKRRTGFPARLMSVAWWIY
jgi:hypothetical protein